MAKQLEGAVLTAPSLSLGATCSVVAQVVRMATSGLVLEGWLCLQSPVSMSLAFDTGLFHTVGCTFESAVGLPVERK